MRVKIGKLAQIPSLGARVVRTRLGDIAVFRNSHDELFALRDACPHKGGALSQGIVCEHTVTCPLHNWNIDLRTGIACAPDHGSAASYPIHQVDGVLYLELPDDGGHRESSPSIECDDHVSVS